MQELLTVTGLILKAEPIGEYDRRVVILTKERGKIAAFARGARKQNNRFMASTNPFSFGEFRLYAGRSSYTLAETFISNYFEGLRSDYEGAYYGMYFLEVCDYCTRENNDERELLKLLYQSLRACVQRAWPTSWSATYSKSRRLRSMESFRESPMGTNFWSPLCMPYRIL